MKKWLFRFLALIACIIVWFLGIVLMDYFHFKGTFPMLILLGAIATTWKFVNSLIIFTDKDKIIDDSKDETSTDN